MENKGKKRRFSTSATGLRLDENQEKKFNKKRKKTSLLKRLLKSEKKKRREAEKKVELFEKKNFDLTKENNLMRYNNTKLMEKLSVVLSDVNRKKDLTEREERISNLKLKNKEIFKKLETYERFEKKLHQKTDSMFSRLEELIKEMKNSNIVNDFLFHNFRLTEKTYEKRKADTLGTVKSNIRLFEFYKKHIIFLFLFAQKNNCSTFAQENYVKISVNLTDRRDSSIFVKKNKLTDNFYELSKCLDRMISVLNVREKKRRSIHTKSLFSSRSRKKSTTLSFSKKNLRRINEELMFLDEDSRTSGVLFQTQVDKKNYILICIEFIDSFSDFVKKIQQKLRTHNEIVQNLGEIERVMNKVVDKLIGKYTRFEFKKLNSNFERRKLEETQFLSNICSQLGRIIDADDETLVNSMDISQLRKAFTLKIEKLINSGQNRDSLRSDVSIEERIKEVQGNIDNVKTYKQQIEYLKTQLRVCDERGVKFQIDWMKAVVELEKSFLREKNLAKDVEMVAKEKKKVEEQKEVMKKAYENQIKILNNNILSLHSQGKQKKEFFGLFKSNSSEN